MAVPIDSVTSVLKRFKSSLRRDGLHLKLGPIGETTQGVFQALHILYQGSPDKANTARSCINDYLANRDLYLQRSKDMQQAIQRNQGPVQKSNSKYGAWYVATKWTAAASGTAKRRWSPFDALGFSTAKTSHGPVASGQSKTRNSRSYIEKK